MFKILHQWVLPLSLLFVFEIMNGYFFSRHHFFKHYKLIYFIWGKNTNKISINVWIIYFFKYFLSLKIRNTFWLSFLIKSFTNEINPLIYNIIIYTSISTDFTFWFLFCFLFFYILLEYTLWHCLSFYWA